MAAWCRQINALQNFKGAISFVKIADRYHRCAVGWCLHLRHGLLLLRLSGCRFARILRAIATVFLPVSGKAIRKVISFNAQNGQVPPVWAPPDRPEPEYKGYA